MVGRDDRAGEGCPGDNAAARARVRRSCTARTSPPTPTDCADRQIARGVPRNVAKADLICPLAATRPPQVCDPSGRCDLEGASVAQVVRPPSPARRTGADGFSPGWTTGRSQEQAGPRAQGVPPVGPVPREDGIEPPVRVGHRKSEEMKECRVRLIVCVCSESCFPFLGSCDSFDLTLERCEEITVKRLETLMELVSYE